MAWKSLHILYIQPPVFQDTHAHSYEGGMDFEEKNRASSANSFWNFCCWNWTHNNIPDRRHSAGFKKSLKVLYHSTLTYVLCTATRTKLEMKLNKWSCLQLWSFMTGSLEAEIYWFRLFLESASVTHNTFTKRCFDRGFLYLCWWLDVEQLAERKIILDLLCTLCDRPSHMRHHGGLRISRTKVLWKKWRHKRVQPIGLRTAKGSRRICQVYTFGLYWQIRIAGMFLGPVDFD